MEATEKSTLKEASSSLPESSLTWCLSQLSKPGPATEDQTKVMTGKDTGGGGRETDTKTKARQWRSLVAIRTQHIKGSGSGITRFRLKGGLKPLLNLIKDPKCSRKTLDLALSILANCCTERETRFVVRKLGGISVVVDILKRNVAVVTVQNRAARALGNLAMDPESSTLIHSEGGVPLLLLCVSLSSAPSSPSADPSKAPCPKMECAQSAARTLLYLSDTPANRLLLVTQGTLSALAPLIAPEYPLGLRRAVLRALHELTRGCGMECAREVSRSGVLAQLGVMASGETGKHFEEFALKTLANLCSQGCLRPLVGSLGAIQKFTEEVKKDALKSGVFLKALCLCCKEAVNRAKVKESGGLEVLIGFMDAHRSHPLSRLTISALVDFVYDESALEQLQELGLVPLLVARLVELAKGEEFSAGKMDVSLTSTMSVSELLSASCFDSFDFPPEGNRKEEAGKDQGLGSSSFLSLRSWLVTEGLISSEGDLPESAGCVEGDWGSLHTPSSSSPSPSSDGPSSSKCSSPSLSLPSTSPRAATLFKVTSSTSVNPAAPLHQPSPCKDAALSAPSHQPSSVSLSSPSKTPHTLLSPSKFSSPPRKRPRVQTAVCSNVVPLDAPPSVPRTLAFHHPYHPEPWAPESPILLLLSRFSHATDPSSALVNSGIISGLLFYLSQHQDPSGRCFRLLCRLSCNPNCLQALVRTGSVALIRHYLCQRGMEREEDKGERQTDRVKAKVKQLGLTLLSNIRVQCESGFGSGVLSHVMLSGSESDKLNCALSLPLINSNKVLLKKLLLDNGGLILALEPMGCPEDSGAEGHSQTNECKRFLLDWLNPPQEFSASKLNSLYFSLLTGCLSSLIICPKPDRPQTTTHQQTTQTPSVYKTVENSPPPLKKPRLANPCPYEDYAFDLLFLLDDGTRVSANREVVSGAEGADVGSEYFRALLTGGFGEAASGSAEAIPIKDVTRGMLLPVLHYLHGCRLNAAVENAEEREGKAGRGHCRVLGSLASEGIDMWRQGSEGNSVEEPGFQKTPLAEVMIGACRFLVTELQREVEDMCVAVLLSPGRTAPDLSEEAGKKASSNMDQNGPEGESADKSLAERTSGLDLSGSEVHAKSQTKPWTVGQVDKLHVSGFCSPLQTEGELKPASVRRPKAKVISNIISDIETVSSIVNQTPRSNPRSIIGKTSPPTGSKLTSTPSEGHLQHDTNSTLDSSCSKAVHRRGVLGALLPQIYCFSQVYSYPRLGRACLSVLLGSQSSMQPFPFSWAGDCLCRLAREADCTDLLKRDLVSLVTTALS
ncbi:armadillo repeat-containing protein 5 [Osmerus mordax]|uniref:armadillo repeat-containing protein 5 n=1 Tax=Osmerus mordax TaxID=8014 RepID=UPI00350F914C